MAHSIVEELKSIDYDFDIYTQQREKKNIKKITVYYLQNK